MIKTIDLSKDGINELQTLVLDLGDILASKELMEYIEKQCEKELNRIINEANFNNWDNEEIWNYRNSFYNIVKKEFIYIYNNSKIDIAEKIASANGKSHIDPNAYPSKLSLAKMVEYGTGIVGATNTDPSGVSSDWQYDVNNHGAKGWVYFDEEISQFVQTAGTEGKLIFYKLKTSVKENICKWVNDYVKKQLKDEVK